MENRMKKMADLKKVTLENQKLREEMLTLTQKNQASLAINDEIYLAKLQAENQKQSEELLALMKRNNALLRKQSELYEKAIEFEKSKEAIFRVNPLMTREKHLVEKLEKGFRK